MSVKTREGNLEVKALTSGPKPVRYADRVCGLQDRWVKWSAPFKGGLGANQAIELEKDRWLLVGKRRLLRKFSLDGGLPAEVPAKEARPQQGCQVELTQVAARIKQGDGDAHTKVDSPESHWWWTLSLEAFGDNSRLDANLGCVATRFFKQVVPVSLTEQYSMSYPAWIARLGEEVNES